MLPVEIPDQPSRGAADTDRTPGPVRLDERHPGIIVASDGFQVAAATLNGFRPEETRRANAAFIVRAWNNHDSLIGSLRAAREEIAAVRDLVLESACVLRVDGDPDRATLGDDPDSKAEVDRLEAVLADIDATLAEADRP